MFTHKTSSLWRDLNFFRLWLASVVSSFGDAAYFILLGWFVIHSMGSPLALGTVLTVASIPRLIFMLIGGVMADRFNRKWILITSLGTRSIVLVFFSLFLLTFHRVHPLLIDTLAIVFGTVDAFFWPANGSIVPLVVTDEKLPTANSLIQTSQQLSAVMGPLIASALLLMHRYADMFLVVALMYLGSAGILLFLRLRALPLETSDANEPTLRDTKNATRQTLSPLRDLASGISYTLSIRILTLIMVASLIINVLFMGPINIGIPVLVHIRDWRGSVYATFEASLGFGAIAGGILIGLLKGLRGHMKWLGMIGSGVGIGIALIGWINNPWQGIVIMSALGVIISVVNIPFTTYIQTIVAQDKLGRVMSLLSFMSIGLTPLSYAGSAFLLQVKWLSLRQLFLGTGSLLFLFWVILTIVPSFRTLEDHPKWKKTA